PVGGPRRRCLAGPAGRRLGWLLGQWPRRHAHQPPCLRSDPAVPVLPLALAPDAVALPGARRCGLGPPALRHHERQGRVRAAPGGEGLPDSTHTRDSWYEANPRCLTHPSQAATRGLTRRDDPTHPCPAQGQTLRKRERGGPPRAACAPPPPAPQEYPAPPPHPEPPAPLGAIVPPLLAGPRGRPRGAWYLRVLRIRPLERHGRGVLRQPGRGEGRDLQGVAGHRPNPSFTVDGI